MRDERSTLSPKLSRFSRLGLAHLPTPLEPMVTEHLGGPKLWVKREDATGTSDLAVQSARFAGADIRRADVAVASAIPR